MKKVIFLLFFVFTTTSMLSAQSCSVEIKDDLGGIVLDTTTVCGGQWFTAHDSNTFSLTVYAWYHNTSWVGGNKKLLATKSGEYVVTVIDNSGCYASDTVYLHVNPNPNSIISPSPNLSCHLESIFDPDRSYQWYRNDSLLSGEIKYFVPASIWGTYYLIETIINTGCVDTSNTFDMKCPLGVSIENPTSFKVCSNPSSDFLYVEVSEKSHLEIYNMLGSRIYSGSVSKSKTKIDVSSFSPGCYILVVTGNKINFKKKIMIF